MIDTSMIMNEKLRNQYEEMRRVAVENRALRDKVAGLEKTVRNLDASLGKLMEDVAELTFTVANLPGVSEQRTDEKALLLEELERLGETPHQNTGIPKLRALRDAALERLKSDASEEDESES